MRKLRQGPVAEFARAEAREIELVEQRRIERGELLALEPVDHVARRGGEIERLQLLRDRVQASQRPAVVVLVMALDELERKAVQQPRPAIDGCELVTHECLRRSL